MKFKIDGYGIEHTLLVFRGNRLRQFVTRLTKWKMIQNCLFLSGIHIVLSRKALWKAIIAKKNGLMIFKGKRDLQPVNPRDHTSYKVSSLTRRV